VYCIMCVNDDRTLLMAVVTTIWGIRLSYNFSRRGGYTWPFWAGEEDYRWPLLRSGTLPGFEILAKPLPWMLFNLIFISFYQNLLLLLIASPAIVANVAAATNCANEINVLDFAAAGSIIFFVLMETFADDQQFHFQTEKYRRKAAKETLTGEFKDGFKQSGMFSFVRKPNYFFEQSIWVAFYLFSVSATGNWLNWSMIGFLLLLALFQGSGKMTEDITIAKYPKYKEYQKRVGLYNPFISLFNDGHKKE